MFTDLRRNPLLLTDAYNLSHQSFKINTDWEISHVYNRKQGQILYGFKELVVTFLNETIITQKMIDEAVELSTGYNLVFPAQVFQRVVDELDGRIPLKVEALPEGTYCPAGTPFAQISNTVEGFGELVTWWEGIFLHAYFPSACATSALDMYDYLVEKKKEHGFDEKFMLRFHDFGFRGHKSLEDAYWADSAWALFLKGSDSIHIAMHHADCKSTSIPALAHKVVQQFDDEYECFIRAIDQTAASGKNIVSLVIDTYDTQNVIKNFVVPLSKYAEEKKVHIVFRPDSSNTKRQSVDIYDKVRENNLKNVSVIIGESMSLDAAVEADIYFQMNNVPLDFVNYGIGAGFYKQIERDTLGWAMKTAYSNGKPRMKFSENPLKRSTPGEIVLLYEKDGNFVVENKDEYVRNGSKEVNQLVEIYNFKNNTDIFVAELDSMTVIREQVSRQNRKQLYVKTSPTIKHMIREFRDKYRK